MKILKKITALYLLLSISLCLLSFTSPISEKSNQDYGGIEEELGYATNRILVVMDEEESLKFRSYTPDYFSEIECKSVTELTSSMKAEAKAALEQNERNADDTTQTKKFNNILCLELKNSGRSSVANAIKTLKDKNGILYVGPDYLITQASVTNDTITKISTKVNDTYATDQWGHDHIHLADAWSSLPQNGTLSATVTVGVIDSGIDWNHPDLSANIDNLKCRDFTSNSCVQETNPIANTSHGTLVAGIIGAIGNNSRGISGICRNIKLVSLKIFNTNKTAFSSNLILAIDYAEDADIPILNFSGAWCSADAESIRYYDEATYYAINGYHGLFVCSAGNQNLNLDLISSTVDVFPAIDVASNMIVVGAFNKEDNLTSYSYERYIYTDGEEEMGSNYGIKSVDIFAPGYNILSTYPDEMCITNNHPDDGCPHKYTYYHYISATSAAAPYVTGVAALLLGAHPSLTTAQLKNAILNNVDNHDGFGYLCVTGGVLNADKVLRYYDHIHNIDYIDYSHTDYHRYVCEDCDNIYYEEHDWEQQRSFDSKVSSRYVPIKICRDCGAIKVDH